MIVDRPPFATLAFIVLCTLGFAVTFLEFWPILSKLFFQPVLLSSVGYSIEPASLGLKQGQVWRVISPSFIHFGWFHFLFNMTCLWLLGRQIESQLGPVYLCALFLLLATTSNTAQYLMMGPHLFGGFSGVNYGLLGFCLFLRNSEQASVITVESSTIAIMFAFLVLGVLPLPEFLGFEDVANTAHIIGFITAVLVALVNPKLSAIFRRQ